MRICAVLVALTAIAYPVAARDGEVAGSVFVEWGFGEGEVRWDGTVEISRGELLNVQPYSFDPTPKVDEFIRGERRWTSLTVGQTDGLTFDVLAPPDAVIVLDTKPGRFEVKLSELMANSPLTFAAANGNKLVATFQRAIALDRVRIGDDTVDDDYPALAVGPAGRAVVVWLRFQEGADQIVAASVDGQKLGQPAAVSRRSGDNFRPQAATLSDGTTWIVWPSRSDATGFDIYARPLKSGRLGAEKRVTAAPGPDLHCCVAAVDDTLWISWQGWRGGSFDILYRTLRGGELSPEMSVTSSAGSDWEPAAAVGPNGEVTCVWDTYRHGSYDVYARTWRDGKWGPEIAVAGTEDFEAHASVAYDSEGVAWIVWENGGPRWGKDSTKGGLHSTRTLELRCLAGETVREPEADLKANFAERIANQCEMGQLIRAGDGRLWLFFRHLVAGGVWAPHASVYGPDGWSAPVALPDSKGRQDQKLGLAAGPSGPPWAAWGTDNRTRNVALNPDVLVAQLVAPASDVARPVPGVRVAVTPVDIPADASRPRRAMFRDGERRLLFGDLHRHTDLSVCQTGRDGSMADLYRYALDAARLDFISVTDHIQHIKVPSAYERWRTEKMTDMYFIPGRLTPLFAYERSQRFPYGHRNIISPTRGQLPVPRTEENRPTSANQGYPGETRIIPPTFWERIRGVNPNQITIPHTSGNKTMGQDWQFNDPELEPVVEIYQGCRISYEHPGAPDPTKPQSGTNEVGSIWTALAKGFRLGFIASSDHAATHNSYACVYAGEHTRQAIVDAIRERRTFAATDTMGLQFSVGGHPLGSEFEARLADPPSIEVDVLGTKPLARIDLIKNNEVVYSTEGAGPRTRFSYQDRAASAGTSYYYVRAIQEDRMMAWGSPVWVTYR
ncbi:MAG: hypothetical protein ACE5JM_06910 [Armatimonadota bacterium]